MLSKILSNQKGQTMLEAIVALVIILLIVTAIAVVIVSGLSNSSFVKNQNEANKYAQQGIETVRNIQRNNLGTFRSYAEGSDPYYCIDESTGSLYSVGCQNVGINTDEEYNRTIEFLPGGVHCNNSNPTTNALQVKVTVRWSSAKCPASDRFCHKSELVSCMPYIYPASNP